MPLEFNRTMRLSDDQYYPVEYEKDLIVLHHTVGGTAKSTFAWWQNEPSHVATAFIIERDGTIFEVFDPIYWAYHLGLKGTGGAHDKRSIGIEIASEGGLLSSDNKLYCFDRITDRTEFKEEYYDFGRIWRGSYRYFASYTAAQIDSVIALVNFLCESFDISRRTPVDHLAYSPELPEYRGILGHHHVRTDKSDLHPGFEWDKLINECKIDLV